jgi:broad specificity phosphatase PhoE
VVVCHGGVIAALLGHALNTDPWRYRGARNASISHIVVEPNEWILRSFNDAAHTGGLTFDHDPA